MIADVAESLSGGVHCCSHTTRHAPHVTIHTSHIAGAILVDQGLVVASTWVRSVLLPHILLQRSGGDSSDAHVDHARAIVAPSPPALHVNRSVFVCFCNAYCAVVLLFSCDAQAFGARDRAAKLRRAAVRGAGGDEGGVQGQTLGVDGGRSCAERRRQSQRWGQERHAAKE